MANILELTKRAVDLEGLGELLHSSRVSVELVLYETGAEKFFVHFLESGSGLQTTLK